MTGLAQGPGEACARGRHDPGCSTRTFAAPDRRVIEGQCQLSTPRTTVTDGQMILTAGLAGLETELDLLVCGALLRGAPLRNRTVDLLLTMDHQTVPVSAVEALSRQDASSRQRRRAQISPYGLHFAPQMPPLMICA
jgi:hypothetical protein